MLVQLVGILNEKKLVRVDGIVLAGEGPDGSAEFLATALEEQDDLLAGGASLLVLRRRGGEPDVFHYDALDGQQCAGFMAEIHLAAGRGIDGGAIAFAHPHW